MSISWQLISKVLWIQKEKSHIKGVIFNQMSPNALSQNEEVGGRTAEVEVLGYVPKVEDCVIVRAVIWVLCFLRSLSDLEGTFAEAKPEY